MTRTTRRTAAYAVVTLTHQDKPLGERQRSVLRALLEHGMWPGGWIWENDSTTVRILESLVRRGLAVHSGDPGALYYRHGSYRHSDALNERMTRLETEQ